MHFFDILNTVSKIAPAGSPCPSRVPRVRTLGGLGPLGRYRMLGRYRTRPARVRLVRVRQGGRGLGRY